QRPALVRAAVTQGEVFAIHIEDADRPPGDVNNLAPARRDFVLFGDDVLHRLNSPCRLPTVVLRGGQSVLRVTESSDARERAQRCGPVREVTRVRGDRAPWHSGNRSSPGGP